MGRGLDPGWDRVSNRVQLLGTSDRRRQFATRYFVAMWQCYSLAPAQGPSRQALARKEQHCQGGSPWLGDSVTRPPSERRLPPWRRRKASGAIVDFPRIHDGIAGPVCRLPCRGVPLGAAQHDRPSRGAVAETVLAQHPGKGGLAEDRRQLSARRPWPLETGSPQARMSRSGSPPCAIGTGRRPWS